MVTGASSGLGLITARQLAAKGAQVVLAVRSLSKGEVAASRIRGALPDAQVEVSELDLSSLASIHAFADRLNGRSPSLDLLVNNAGIMMTPPRTTADGFPTSSGRHSKPHMCSGTSSTARVSTGGPDRP